MNFLNIESFQTSKFLADKFNQSKTKEQTSPEPRASVITTKEKLGRAYQNASLFIYSQDPMSPRIMGAMWREQFGLHHEYKKNIFGKYTYWIEFPNADDYFKFLQKWDH